MVWFADQIEFGTFHLSVPCDCCEPWRGPQFSFSVGSLSYVLFLPKCWGRVQSTEAMDWFEEMTGYRMVRFAGPQSDFWALPPSTAVPMSFLDGAGRMYALAIYVEELWNKFLRNKACNGCGKIPTKDEWLNAKWPGWPRRRGCCNFDCAMLAVRRQAKLEKALRRTSRKRASQDLEEFLTVGALHDIADAAR